MSTEATSRTSYAAWAAVWTGHAASSPWTTSCRGGGHASCPTEGLHEASRVSGHVGMRCECARMGVFVWACLRGCVRMVLFACVCLHGCARMGVSTCVCLRGCVCMLVSAWVCPHGCVRMLVSAWVYPHGCVCMLVSAWVCPHGCVRVGVFCACCVCIQCV